MQPEEEIVMRTQVRTADRFVSICAMSSQEHGVCNFEIVDDAVENDEKNVKDRAASLEGPFINPCLISSPEPPCTYLALSLLDKSFDSILHSKSIALMTTGSAGACCRFLTCGCPDRRRVERSSASSSPSVK